MRPPRKSSTPVRVCCLPLHSWNSAHTGWSSPDLTCRVTGELETGFEVDRVTCEAGSAIIFTEGQPALPIPC